MVHAFESFSQAGTFILKFMLILIIYIYINIKQITCFNVRVKK